MRTTTAAGPNTAARSNASTAPNAKTTPHYLHHNKVQAT
jgi:hypothetical protein